MFNIDKQSVTTSIAVSIIPFLDKEDGTDPKAKLEYYFRLVMDMAVGVLNTPIRIIDDAIELQLDRFQDDKQVPFLAETVRLMVMDAKRQFIQAGFDGRLKYKLYERKLGRMSMFGIGMDLDATMEELSQKPEVEQEAIEDVVSDHASFEQLDAVLKTWHIGGVR